VCILLAIKRYYKVYGRYHKETNGGTRASYYYYYYYYYYHHHHQKC